MHASDYNLTFIAVLQSSSQSLARFARPARRHRNPAIRRAPICGKIRRNPNTSGIRLVRRIAQHRLTTSFWRDGRPWAAAAAAELRIPAIDVVWLVRIVDHAVDAKRCDKCVHSSISEVTSLTPPAANPRQRERESPIATRIWDYSLTEAIRPVDLRSIVLGA